MINDLSLSDMSTEYQATGTWVEFLHTFLNSRSDKTVQLAHPKHEESVFGYRSTKSKHDLEVRSSFEIVSMDA
jgi:hypothetical protein